MNINQRVQEMLTNSKLTQKELSSYISVAPSTLNNWIKLGRSIPAEYIIPICEFFDVSLEYLLTGKENSNISTISNSIVDHSSGTITVSGTKEIQPKSNTILSETEEELLNVFKKLPTRERVKLLNIVYDFEEKYKKSNK